MDHDDSLAPILIGMLEEGSLDAVSSHQLAVYLARCWSMSPLNEHYDLLCRADLALALQGSSLVDWFSHFSGLPAVVAISNQTLRHLQDAYDMLDANDYLVAQQVHLDPKSVPNTFIATIEYGLGCSDFRQAGRGATLGLFGLETAYLAESLPDHARQVRVERNRLFSELALIS